MEERKRKSAKAYTICGSIVLFFGCIAPVFGAIEIESIAFGFEEHAKRERWVPLQVLVVSQDEPEAFVGELQLVVRDVFSGEPIQTYTTPLSLMPTDRQRRVLTIFQPGVSIKLELKLIKRNGRIAAAQELIPKLPKQAQDLFLLALTPNRDILSRWNGQPIQGGKEGHLFVAYVDTKNLPTNWKGYDSVDIFVIRGVSLTERRISPKQQTALLDWLEDGGTLLVSGGSDFQYVRKSFLEPFLPVTLNSVKTVTHLPEDMWRFRFETTAPFNLIDFTLSDNGQILMGNTERVYVAQSSLGSGQIISLGFDYNAPPFSASPGSEAFWTWLLQTVGRSPRKLEARKDPHRRHPEKLQELLTATPSTHAPLIRFLAVFLAVYLLTFGGFTWWVGRRAGRRARIYWLGGVLIPLVFSGGVFLSRHLLPSAISVHQFSILSVYPERNRARLQSYIGLIASAHTETSIRLNGGTFIKPLRPGTMPPPHLFETQNTELRQTALNPWRTSVYTAETFLDSPIRAQVEQNTVDGTLWLKHHLPAPLENAWFISKDRYSYLGTMPPDTSVNAEGDFSTSKAPPFPQDLMGTRKAFAQILSDEVVLRYLLQEESPKLVGWLKRSFLPLELNHPVNAVAETFVILYF